MKTAKDMGTSTSWPEAQVFHYTVERKLQVTDRTVLTTRDRFIISKHKVLTLKQDQQEIMFSIIK
jgi:hypothetical protein